MMLVKVHSGTLIGQCFSMTYMAKQISRHNSWVCFRCDHIKVMVTVSKKPSDNTAMQVCMGLPLLLIIQDVILAGEGCNSS